MTFIGNFQRYIADIGPYFLRNKNLGTFLESFALTYDSAIQSLDMGLRMSQPSRCDASALPTLGRDRGIPFYPSESEQSKRERLQNWLTLRRQRGTHQGELRHSQRYFSPAMPLMRIVHQSGGVAPMATWHTLDTAGEYSVHRQTLSNWNWDGQTSAWSRFWAIVYPPASYCSLIQYGDGSAYGDGSVYAGAASSQIAQDLVAMVRDWASAHAKLAGYIIATDPSSFDPTQTASLYMDGTTSLPIGNWGAPANQHGRRTRLQSAIFLYDRRSTL